MYEAENFSSNLITSIVQDAHGYVWIGTEYGLNRFDGVYVRQYYNDDSDKRSLVSDIVRNVAIDHEGTLWVVCNRGVQRYDRMSDAFETVNWGNSWTADINDILHTREGKIWVLSATHGVYQIDKGTMKAQPVATINKHMKLQSVADNMYLDSKGRLWIAYVEDGLQMIDTRQGKSVHYKDVVAQDNRVVDITEDKHHRLTIATYTALLQLNETTKQFEPLVTYQRNAVNHIFKRKDGKLLIGTSGSGLWTVDVDKRELSTGSYIAGNQADISQAKVYAYLEDDNDNQWLGCYQTGLMMISGTPHPFHFLPLAQLPTNNGKVLRALFADDEKNVYVCQEQGGIVVYSPNGSMLHHWMGNRTVMDVYKDRQEMLWVGTYRDGLFRLDRATGRETSMPLTAGQRISSITQDKDGNLYTAVFSEGLYSYTDDGTTERLLGKGKLKLMNPYLNVLFTDKDGLIWIGHYYGIDIYDPKSDKLVTIELPQTLRAAVVYAIEQSTGDHSIWVGSNKGLFQYQTQGARKGEWKRFTTHDGLPNNIVCGIVIDNSSTLWVSTYRGLAQIEPDGNIISYYRGNGLEDWSYLRGVYAWTGIGEVVLGSQNGITYFSPKNIKKRAFKKGIALTGMRLGNADVNATMLSNDKYIITKPLDEAGEISVSYLDNTFSLRFSTMDFRDEQNVHYEYRFDGETDNQWHHTESGKSEIFLSRLAVGIHKLIVRAYDNGLYSSEKVIVIRVTPPWYRTWGAYAFYLMVLLAIILLWWRNYWNKRQAELNEEKIKFFVDISHELRSPLTLIKTPLEQMLKSTHDPQTTRALRNMERNTNRLLLLLSQILSIRKIEKKQMTMHFAETMLGDFVGDICNDYEYQVKSRKIKLTFDNKAPGMKVWIDRDNFDKVVTNLIGNAIKYVEDGGEINVIVEQTGDGYAQLTVRDNGPGIDEAQLKKVFDRFYQASNRPASGQMSYGLGLNLSQKLVAMHKGTISARNRKDTRGSEFVVQLPLGNKHLSPHQLVDSSYYAVPAAETKSMVVTDADKPRKPRKKTTYHIAIVDDDEEIRYFLQTELGETYYVHTYADGQKALEGIVDQVPDLVVSDVVMPKMDGIELLKRLKASTTTSHIPVILLTTRTDHQARLEGLEQGADAYVDKPFNFEELETRIASLIANRIRMRGKFSGIQEQEDTIRKVELKGNDATLMEKIMKAINEHLDDSDFNVEALADEIGLSRVQLHRRMKELTGITVGEFIRNLRLQQAAKLLQKGDITVSQVTYAVGFANPTHFASAFKKHFGVTPSEYMAKHQAKKEDV